MLKVSLCPARFILRVSLHFALNFRFCPDQSQTHEPQQLISVRRNVFFLKMMYNHRVVTERLQQSDSSDQSPQSSSPSQW